MVGMSRQEGINRVRPGPAHIVILGAGASIASTLHNPEPSGKKLPSMANLVEVVGLSTSLEKANIDPKGDFEVAYSRLYERDPDSLILKEIERKIREYFRGLKLPSTPTIYDYLILALRPKDFIATFNWDPFLYQAFCRHRRVGRLPHIAFLHGNVALGYSERDQRAGPAGYFSKETGEQFSPTKLLYPVSRKNYSDDTFISREWNRLRRELKQAKRLTFFGYSAPSTDVEAVDLMSSAWGDPNQRDLEQIEIIDILPREVVRARWAKFIHSHHYDYCSDYFQSVLADFPRRTGESFMHQFLPAFPDEAFQKNNPVSQFKTLEEMWQWHLPLLQAEARILREEEEGV